MIGTHLLTFDIEHWYESWRMRGLPFDKKLDDCDTPCVYRLLDLLDEKKQKATFFSNVLLPIFKFT